jgi:hypothetical protein
MNIISLPISKAVGLSLKMVGKSALYNEAKLGNGILLKDAFENNFRTLAKETVEGKPLGYFGALKTRTQAYFALITKPVKKIYNFIAGFFKKSEANAAKGAQADAAAPQAPVTPTPAN